LEQLEWGKNYLPGLLGEAPRKNIERIAADCTRTKKVRRLQHFNGQSPWEQRPLIAIHQQRLGETLVEADGIALIDESSVVKQGMDWLEWLRNNVDRCASDNGERTGL
jgi:SRSO17 transposase